MKRFFLTIILTIGTLNILSAQKPPLTHDVYDTWESIGSVTSPYNGKYLFYSINQQEGNSTFYLQDIQTDEKIVIPRAKSPILSKEGTYFICTIAPAFNETREAKIKKAKGDKMPKDSLFVLNLKTKESKKYAKVKGVATPKDLDCHVAFASAVKDSLNSMFVLNINNMSIDTLNWVDKYTFGEDGSSIYYVSKYNKKDSLSKVSLYEYNLTTKTSDLVLEGDKEAKIILPSFNKKGDKIAFYAQLDTTKENKEFVNIYFRDKGKGVKADLLIANNIKGMKDGWKIGEKGRLSFSDNDTYLSFGTVPIPPQKDTLTPEFERAKLDIWVWDAEYTPPMKKARKMYYDSKTYTALYYFNQGGQMVQVMDESFASLRLNNESKQDYILATVDEPYRMQQQWNYNARVDLYRVNIKTGAKEIIIKDDAVSRLSPSPKGNYYTWYNAKEKNWYLYSVASNVYTNITKDLECAFWDEDEDTPSYPAPYSPALWFQDESSFIIGDRFDLWSFDPMGVKPPVMITQGVGATTQTQFVPMTGMLYSPKKEGRHGLVYDYSLYKDEILYMSSFNRDTKERGIYSIDLNKRKQKLVKLVEGPYSYSLRCIVNSYDYLRNVREPRQLKIPFLIYTQANFENAPKLLITKDLFRENELLIESNQQQKKYNWGRVELVSWMTDDSIRAEGLLYKPEDFDASKKYPVMIYFYEKNSDGLYSYRVPAPSRSTVNVPYFVSNGYIVFIPDIYYTVGHPGQSAMKSIMPGVDMLCKNSWIDAENMAIQGQSWGGYQVAYMITQTDRFKAAGAGAPVSNMTSAYGGIRWGSGLTRQFQYEQTQSRIGKDLWSGFDLYIENSPLFFVPKVNTPVLIMHNDKDGAVPWYQGIEFFSALRRCDKQAWLLQYNDEEHNLSERRNAKDLSVRLSEFFDHFLKGAPEPEWMKVKRP